MDNRGYFHEYHIVLKRPASIAFILRQGRFDFVIGLFQIYLYRIEYIYIVFSMPILSYRGEWRVLLPLIQIFAFWFVILIFDI